MQRRSRVYRWLLPLLIILLLPLGALAEMRLLAPGRTVDPSTPFRLTLLITAEGETRTYSIPEVIRVDLTPELGATSRVELQRETPIADRIDLRSGQFISIGYVGRIPGNLRGRLRVDAVDIDASPMLVQLVQPRESTAQAEPPATTAVPAPKGDAKDSSTPPTASVTVGTGDDPNLEPGRLSFNEPMFFVVGPGVDANAQFQLSFKLRLYEPRDLSTRDLWSNLYFAYTQTSFWDLTSDSKPFVDTSYRPSLFYYVPDVGMRLGGHRFGLAAGYEHESNGNDEIASRSIDILFLRPDFVFGQPSDFHWTFSPKLYVYVEKSENEDIADYRGYGDFRFTYGKDDDWRLAATLRKGTQGGRYSVDAQWTYPLNRLWAGLAGYFTVQYFNGWGETLLEYNQRESWRVRAGYALSR